MIVHLITWSNGYKSSINPSFIACLVFGVYLLVNCCYAIYTREYNRFKDVELTLVDGLKLLNFSAGLDITFGVGPLFKFYDLRYNKSLN